MTRIESHGKMPFDGTWGTGERGITRDNEQEDIVNARILDNLMSLEEPSLGSGLISSIIAHPNELEIIFAGPPGCGKTLLAQTLIEELPKRDFSVHARYFDDVLDAVTARLCVPYDEAKEGPRANWTREDWDFFDRELELTFDNTPTKVHKLLGSKHGRREYDIEETNSSGTSQAENRGQGMLERRAARIRLTDPEALETRLIYLVPNPKVQSDALEQRDFVLRRNIRDRDIISRFERRFNKRVINIDDYVSYMQQQRAYFPDNPSVDVLQGRLFRMQLAKMAPKRRINVYQEEYKQAVMQLIRQRKIRPVSLPENATIGLNAEESIVYGWNMAYTYYHVRQELGLDSKHASVALFPYMKEQLVIDAATWIPDAA